MPINNRFDALERHMRVLNGQMQALAALSAMRIGSAPTEEQPVHKAEPAVHHPGWELALAERQVAGLIQLMGETSDGAVREGLQGIWELIDTALADARLRRAALL